MPICLVIPQLYIGDIQGAESYNELKSLGITHVVQAMGGMQPMFPKEFHYKVIDCMDTPSANLSAHFESTCAYMSKVVDNGGKVLVHCWAGVSRSATICIAFLMYRLGVTLHAATLMCRKNRPQVYPNPGFQSQLQNFEKKLKLLRYQDNQQARYLEDYTTVSKRMRQTSIEGSAAGLTQDWFQLNHGYTKDRMGFNGLVNKGKTQTKDLPFVRDRRADFGRATLSSDCYGTKWMHNDADKKHSYYSKPLWKKGEADGSILNTRTFGAYGTNFEDISPLRLKNEQAKKVMSQTTGGNFQTTNSAGYSQLMIENKNDQSRRAYKEDLAKKIERLTIFNPYTQYGHK